MIKNLQEEIELSDYSHVIKNHKTIIECKYDECM